MIVSGSQLGHHIIVRLLQIFQTLDRIINSTRGGGEPLVLGARRQREIARAQRIDRDLGFRNASTCINRRHIQRINQRA